MAEDGPRQQMGSSPDWLGILLDEIHRSRSETRELIEGHKTETRDLIEKNTNETIGLRDEVANLAGQFMAFDSAQKVNKQLWESRIDGVEKELEDQKKEFGDHKGAFAAHAASEASIINQAKGAVKATKMFYAAVGVIATGLGVAGGGAVAGTLSPKAAPAAHHSPPLAASTPDGGILDASVVIGSRP